MPKARRAKCIGQASNSGECIGLIKDISVSFNQKWPIDTNKPMTQISTLCYCHIIQINMSYICHVAAVFHHADFFLYCLKFKVITK